METTALRLFMRHGTGTEVLRREIGEMERAAAKGRVPQLVTVDLRFHRHIAEHCGNPVVERFFKDLEGSLMLVMAMDDRTFEDIAEVAAEHIPVVEAIESGDEAVAVRIFHEHIVSTAGNLLDRLGGDGSTLLRPVDG